MKPWLIAPAAPALLAAPALAALAPGLRAKIERKAQAIPRLMKAS